MEEKLLISLADILEVDEDAVTLDTEFKTDAFDWDSLKGYATLVTIEDEFGVTVSVDDFIAAKTPRDLLSLIGCDA
ncbi:MAG: acyl carrier protein [Clostridiales Family XIII bacterium]|nr:acyl carrier protein [Clostridiales Family XIII bacterium]